MFAPRKKRVVRRGSILSVKSIPHTYYYLFSQRLISELWNYCNFRLIYFIIEKGYHPWPKDVTILPQYFLCFTEQKVDVSLRCHQIRECSSKTDFLVVGQLPCIWQPELMKIIVFDAINWLKIDVFCQKKKEFPKSPPIFKTRFFWIFGS